MNSENTYTHTEYDRESTANDYVSQMTPSETQTLCEVNTSKYIVPIIFIPGIMGSNLVNGKKNVWFPPNAKFKEGFFGVGTLISSIFRGASSRQKELDPMATKVSFDGPIYLKKSEIKLTQEQAYERGWGTVWWTGYGHFLTYLEKYFNNKLVDLSLDQDFKGTSEWQKIVDQIKLPKEGNNLTEYTDQSCPLNYREKWILKDEQQIPDAITKKQFNKVGLIEFPVYGCGYNWLQSNDKSAQDIIERMEKIKQKYSSGNGPQFLKFIIVSHSMGGLVTRSLVEQGLMADDIGGVVHGVQPASGAPAVYQRIVNGWDGKAATGDFMASITALVMGHNSKRMTPVLANSPGALQLLPFPNFNDNGDYDWLKIEIGNRIIKVPIKNDPYTNIYTKQNIWWEMINPQLVDPSGQLKTRLAKEGMTNVIEFYYQNIATVKKFQIKIKDIFHERTYAHYGADENFKATADIIWKVDEKSIKDLNTMSDDEIIHLGYNKAKGLSESSPYTSDDHIRKVTYIHNGQQKSATFTLQVKLRTKGDGTVCYQSGQDVRAENRKLLESYVINGYEHGDSYNNPDVQLNTLYCITKLIDQLVKDSEVGETK